MYKIRFHLGRGKHYMHWQIKDKNGNVEYFNPDEVQLLFYNCRLHNQVNASKKIFGGENKRPCAWIVCTHYEVAKPVETPEHGGMWISFSPRRSPHWQLCYTPDYETHCDNMDNYEYRQMFTHARKVYPHPEECYLV